MGRVEVIGAVITAQTYKSHTLTPIDDRLVLDMVIERALAIEGLDRVVVSTSSLMADRPIVKRALACGVVTSFGPVTDAWERHRIACQDHQLSVMVRLSGTGPLVDPLVVGPMVRAVASGTMVYAKAIRFPIGLDVEVASVQRFLQCKPESIEDHRDVTGPLSRAARHEKKDGIVQCSMPLGAVKWDAETDEDVSFLRALVPTLMPGHYSWRHTLTHAADLVSALPEDSPLLAAKRAA